MGRGTGQGLGTALLVVLLLGIVAVASSSSGGSETPRSVTDYAFTLAVVLGAIAALSVIALLASHVRLPPVRRQGERSTVVAILVAAGIVALGTLVVGHRPLDLDRTTES